MLILVNSDQEFETLLKEHERQLDEEERQKEERKKAKKAKEPKQKVKRRKEDCEDGEETQVKLWFFLNFILKFLARTPRLL